jgi:acetolactate synthase-1/2/3 large subunit
VKKVSDIVSQFFEQKEIRNVFLLSGGMMMHLLDSISKSRNIKYICNHHEQASAMAAEAYARITGNIGLCYATSGPGATNLITGIAGAWLDSSPVFFITGQSRTQLTIRGSGIPDLRMFGNFEVDIVSIVKPITKYAVVLDRPENVLFELEKAFYIAKEGRPGPVLIDFPLDIQGSMVDEFNLKKFQIPEKRVYQVEENQYSIVIEKLKSSKRPLIIGGNGIRISAMVDEFRKIVSDLKIPVVTTQLANDLMPYQHNQYVGKLGLRGDRAGNFAIQTADLIISIGSSLHITNTGYELEYFAPEAFKIVIDIDKAVLQKNLPISDFQINVDVNSFLENVLKKIEPSDLNISNSWIQRLEKIKNKYQVINENLIFSNDNINTYSIVDAISDLLKGDEIIITDAGSLYYIIGQTFKAKNNQRVIVSGALGAMGYALPAAIGASIAEPNKQVICITGDGSMQTNIQELQTISNYNLNCKIIVLNNKGYASIRNSQSAFQEGHVAASSESTGVTFPNWGAVANSYKLNFKSEKSYKNLRNFLSTILSEEGPLFAEIIIPENVIMQPSVTSKKLDNGSFKSNTLDEMTPAIFGDSLLDITKKDY